MVLKFQIGDLNRIVDNLETSVSIIAPWLAAGHRGVLEFILCSLHCPI